VEATILIVKNRLIARKNFWQQSCFSPAYHPAIRSSVATIEEAVFFFVMAVQIAKNIDPAAALNLVDHRKF